ncbi:hypothetical protein TrVFT333_002191 [Trichoderma virens FT-333]|nr:hypothetical protein TrVFT333_002191 [Trichoderma virens FT-333]
MASLPATYQAVVLTEANAPFELHEVQLQHPGPGQVLVKVVACGVCFSDVALASGHMGNVFPRTPGHELVGDIVELGQNVTRFTIGERVGSPWHGGHDGSCRQCKRGQFQLCEQQTINGVTQDGGFAESRPLLCAGVTVFNGIRKLHVEQGAIVAVQGLGGLGHLAVQYANKMGYEVAVLSSGDDKAAFAKELGAHHYINTKKVDGPAELAKLGGASIIVQTAPNPGIIGRLVNGLAPGGKLLCLTPVGGVEFDTAALVSGARSVHGWPSGHAIDSEDAIRFAQVHGIKCMVEECKAIANTCGNPQSCDNNNCKGEFNLDNGIAYWSSFFDCCVCNPTSNTCGNPQFCDSNGCAGAYNSNGGWDSNGNAVCKGNFAGCPFQATTNTCGALAPWEDNRCDDVPTLSANGNVSASMSDVNVSERALRLEGIQAREAPAATQLLQPLTSSWELSVRSSGAVQGTPLGLSGRRYEPVSVVLYHQQWGNGLLKVRNSVL